MIAFQDNLIALTTSFDQCTCPTILTWFIPEYTHLRADPTRTLSRSRAVQASVSADATDTSAATALQATLDAIADTVAALQHSTAAASALAPSSKAAVVESDGEEELMEAAWP